MATTLKNEHTCLSSRVKGGGGGVNNPPFENEHTCSFSGGMGGVGDGKQWPLPSKMSIRARF